MLRTIIKWELERHRNDRSPFVIAIVPAIMLLPLERPGIFDSWPQGAMVIGWIYAFVLASRIGADSGLLQPSAIWVFQKGHSLVDYSLARLIASAVFSLCFVIYASGWYSIGAALHGDYTVIQHFAWTLTVATVVWTSLPILYLVGACGTRRTADFLIIIAVVSLLQNILLAALPDLLSKTAALVLPPFIVANQFVADVLRGPPSDALLDAMHIFAYSCACVAAAAVLHARWRPRLSSSG